MLFLVSIPILLICGVMLMMPSSSTHSSFSDEKFAIVIDAGSTGSRVHIFRFNTAGGALDLESDTFEQLKPGLSHYAANPTESAESLKPLLDKALATVPAEQHKTTTVEVRATAGLRLLPDGQADGILKAVRAFLKNSYPFKSDSKSVSILDGAASLRSPLLYPSLHPQRCPPALLTMKGPGRPSPQGLTRARLPG